MSVWLKAPVVTAWSALGTALLVTLFLELSLNEAVGAYMAAAVIMFIMGVSGTFDAFVRGIFKGAAALSLAIPLVLINLTGAVPPGMAILPACYCSVG